MKLPKLDTRGVAHHFLLALIVVGVACVGTYYVVFSNASSVTYKNGRISVGNATSEMDGSQKVWTAMSGTSFAALSPNGKHYAYQVARYDNNAPYKIGVIEVGEKDENKAKIISLPSGKQYTTTSWSPDGSWLMVKTEDTVSPNKWGVWLVKPDGTGGKPGPAMENGEGNSIAWMPDSASIFFTKKNNATSSSDLCTVKLDGSGRKCNPMKSEGPKEIIYFDSAKVSPDGTKVLFKSLDGVQNTDNRPINLNIINIDGSDLRQITNYKTGTQVVDFLFSPDKLSALFRTGANENEFYSVNLSTKPVKTSAGMVGNNPYLSVKLLKGMAQAVGSGNLDGWEQIGPAGVPTVNVACSIEAPSSVIAWSDFKGNVRVTNNSSVKVRPAMTDGTIKTVNGSFNGNLSIHSVLPQTDPGGVVNTPSFNTKFTQIGTAVLSTSGTAEHYRGQVSFNCSKTSAVTAQTYTVSCVVKDVPKNVKKGSDFKPSVTITATGNQPTWVNITAVVNPNKGASSSISGAEISSISPGASQNKKLGKYTVPGNTKASSAVVKVTAEFAGGQTSCQDSFDIKN